MQTWITGKTLSFVSADSAAEAADKVVECYKSNVDTYGVDNVQVLTRFVRKGKQVLTP